MINFNDNLPPIQPKTAKAEYRYKLKSPSDGLNHYVDIIYQAFQDGSINIIKMIGHEGLNQADKNDMLLDVYCTDKLFYYAFEVDGDSEY